MMPSRHTIAKQSTAVLALGLGLAVGAPAEAGIVYTPVGQTFSNDVLEFLDYPGTGNMFGIAHVGYSNPYLSYNYAKIRYITCTNASVAVSDNYYVSLLNKGEIISGALSWYAYGSTLAKVNTDYNNNTYKYGYFLGKKGYIGLQFDAGDGTHYGWAEVFMPDDASSVTLFGYAYETEVETDILAGAGDPNPVPLPGSLVLLASGAAGLLAYRRMKRAA